MNNGLSSVSFHFEPCGFEKGNEIGGTVVVSMHEGDQPVRLAAPYEVSSRKIAAASPPAPLSRRQTFASRSRSPAVGHVLAKNWAGSAYPSIASPRTTRARSAGEVGLHGAGEHVRPGFADLAPVDKVFVCAVVIAV